MHCFYHLFDTFNMHLKLKCKPLVIERPLVCNEGAWGIRL